MIELQKTADGLIHITASGQLTAADYDAFAPRFEAMTTPGQASAPMLIDLAPELTWDLSAVWRELKFDARHADRFGRIAIVGDKQWESVAVKLSAPFIPGTIRYFDHAERESARSWLLDKVVRTPDAPGAGR